MKWEIVIKDDRSDPYDYSKKEVARYVIEAKDETEAAERAKQLVAANELLGSNSGELSYSVEHVLGYKAAWLVENKKLYQSKERAEKYISEIENRLREAELLENNNIWTTVEMVYETRYDCSTARLAAAA